MTDKQYERIRRIIELTEELREETAAFVGAYDKLTDALVELDKALAIIADELGIEV